MQTELPGAEQARDPHAMPLKAFIEEVMSIIAARPRPPRFAFNAFLGLRLAAASGNYPLQFKSFNDALAEPAAASRPSLV